jgi:hypothetical protein
MPNWCTNNLVVCGSESEMKKFYKKFNGAAFSFNCFVPLPLELSDVTSPTRIITQKEYDNQQGSSRMLTEELSNSYKNNFGYDNWYDWQTNNWGTKWDASVSSETKDDDYFHVWFDTAWSPPLSFISKLSKMFPNLSFELKYEEEGMGFCGGVFAKSIDEIWDEYLDDIEYNDDGEIINSVFDS